MTKGLFLGAGASYEVGMPLVWGLTGEIRDCITPSKFTDWNKKWNSQGEGYSEEIASRFIACLQHPDMHYENILANIEVQAWRDRTNSTAYRSLNHLYGWFIDLVYQVLLLRHIRNDVYIRAGLRFLEGVIGLTTQDSPLWVFSLNHDLIIEALAAEYGKTVSSGFNAKTTLPLRDQQGTKISDLECELHRGQDFDRIGLDFQSTPADIHLIKLHGSLDTFMTNEGKDFLKIAPRSGGAYGVIQTLRSANESLVYIDRRFPGRTIRTTNEINYADEAGVMQFLRKTLLSGARKFEPRSHQTLPLPLMKHFGSNLSHVTELIMIGYGLGDLHVNHAIRDWLEFSLNRRLTIVGPGVKTCPPFASHVREQVILVDQAASSYLEQFALTPLTRQENLLRRMRVAQRNKLGR